MQQSQLVLRSVEIYVELKLVYKIPSYLVIRFLDCDVDYCKFLKVWRRDQEFQIIYLPVELTDLILFVLSLLLILFTSVMVFYVSNHSIKDVQDFSVEVILKLRDISLECVNEVVVAIKVVYFASVLLNICFVIVTH